MTATTPWLYALLLLTILLTTACLLLIRRPGPAAMALAAVAALGATMTGYAGWQLLQTPTPPAFALEQQPGHFQDVQAGQLDAALLAARSRPVLLDFYADWCSSCQVWEQQVFSRPEVKAALQGHTLLRMDVSDMTPEQQAALSRFGLAGLPALLLFAPEGGERQEYRILGEMPADAFLSWLEKTSAP